MTTELDYFFEFNSEAAAFADTVVSPFLSNPAQSRTNIWAFDLDTFSLLRTPPPTQYGFYWCMVGQGGPNSALAAHPQLRFVLVLPANVLYENMYNGMVAISVNTQRANKAKSWSLGLTTESPFSPGFGPGFQGRS